MAHRIAILAGLLVVGAFVLGATDILDQDVRTLAAQSLPSLSPPRGADAGAADSAGADPKSEDGDLDDRSLSVDSAEPAVSRLDPELLAALRAAAQAAAAGGVEVRVGSGWRSKDYQQQLLDEAIAKYGSRLEALRWVSTPDTSAHVTGHAVDVSPTDAAYWMREHGADYGLCQTYANEIWHFELLTAPGATCPPPRADAAS